MPGVGDKAGPTGHGLIGANRVASRMKEPDEDSPNYSFAAERGHGVDSYGLRGRNQARQQGDSHEEA